MIYELPSLNFFNLYQGKLISKIFNKSEQKINLIYSYYQVVWQGPAMVFEVVKKLENSRIFCLVDCKNNVGLTLSFLRIGIKKIVFDSSNNNSRKIDDIACKYKAKLFDKKKFENKIFLKNFTSDHEFKKNLIFELKKHNLIQ